MPKINLPSAPSVPIPSIPGINNNTTNESSGYSMSSAQMQNNRESFETTTINNNNNNSNEEEAPPADEEHAHLNQASHQRTWDEKIQEESFTLEEDTLSLLYLCPYFSLTFVVSLLVFAIQLFIIVLILADLTRGAPTYSEVVFFPLDPPVNVETQVVVAQFISLIIACFKEEDIFYSLKAIVIVGHDERVCVRFPGATPFKWWLANSFRFITGFCSIAISFYFIVGSDSVLDIFEGFAAMEFVSYIDNIIFRLAKWGYLGKPFQRLTIKVESVTMENRREKGRYWAALTISFLLLTLVPLITFWCKVRIAQQTGFYLNNTISPSVAVKFGKEQFDLPLTTTFFNLSESIRDLTSFDESLPPQLQYAYFSGSYKVSYDNDWKLVQHNDRPIYYERNAELCKNGEPTCGMFYYCDELSTWVYSIPALGTALKERDKCKWGWLAQSEQTDVYSLEDVNDETWKVYTGVMTETSVFIKSDSCNLDSDCSLNGQCIEGVCNCDDDWQGRYCHVRKPSCPALLFVDYGETSYNFEYVTTYELALHRDQTTGELLTNRSIQVYDRPVYYRTLYDFPADNAPGTEATRCKSRPVYELYMYNGRRWYSSFWCQEDIDRFVVDGELRIEENFHAFWDNSIGMDLKWFSELTESYTGTGLQMFEIRDSYSTGSIGDYGVAFQSFGTFECMDIPCANDAMVCGRKGKCEPYNFVTPITNQSVTWNKCTCKDYYGGPFCQFNPYEDYTRDHFQQYLSDPTATKDNEYQIRYWDPWRKTLGNNTSPSSDSVGVGVTDNGQIATIAPTTTSPTSPAPTTATPTTAQPTEGTTTTTTTAGNIFTNRTASRL